jgi:hypothetical protein
MERDSEAARLINVIRVTAKMAMRLAWSGAGPEVSSHCIGQYNKVLARLKELDPQFAPFFQALPPNSSLQVAAMACRQLAGYFDDAVRLNERSRRRHEHREHRSHGHGYRYGRYAGL